MITNEPEHSKRQCLTKESAEKQAVEFTNKKDVLILVLVLTCFFVLTRLSKERAFFRKELLLCAVSLNKASFTLSCVCQLRMSYVGLCMCVCRLVCFHDYHCVYSVGFLSFQVSEGVSFGSTILFLKIFFLHLGFKYYLQTNRKK